MGGSINNIPNKFDIENRFIDSEVNFNTIRIVNRRDDDHMAFLILEMRIDVHPEDVARQIAQALTAARDIGFEQGRKHIRDALGITA
jgi:hypothetical protein